MRTPLKWKSSLAGLYTVGWLPLGVGNQRISQLLLNEGIVVPALSSFAPLPSNQRVGVWVAAGPEAEIRRAVPQMRDILASSPAVV